MEVHLEGLRISDRTKVVMPVLKKRKVKMDSGGFRLGLQPPHEESYVIPALHPAALALGVLESSFLAPLTA